MMIRDADNRINTSTLGSVILEQPEEIQATVSNTPESFPTAADATITISSVTGGSGSYVIIKDSMCPVAQTITGTMPEAPTGLELTMIETKALCYGDDDAEIRAEVTGGTQPYRYQWSHDPSLSGNTATGLPLGTYSVKVIDANGCEATDLINITEPTQILLDIETTELDCDGDDQGAATVTATNGAGNYSYLWNDPNTQTTPTATGLTAGIYTVTVTDANNCSVSATVIISQPSQLTASISKTNVQCAGESNGTATVQVSGGTAGYSYLWDDPLAQTTPTAMGLAAGTYTVTVTDGNNCQISETVMINEPLELTAGITATQLVCFGDDNGVAAVQVSGGTTPYTYLWDDPLAQKTPMATGLTARTYTVLVTDANNCTTSASITIDQPVELTGNIVSIIHVPCIGGNEGSATVLVSGGTPGYTYLWDDPLAQTTPTATGLTAGNYQLLVTDANNCQLLVPVVITEPDLGLNQPPVVLDDQATTAQTIPVTIDVLDNDTDDSSIDPTTLDIIDWPLNGTVVVNPDFTVTYTPTGQFVGQDEFTYRIYDDGIPCGVLSDDAKVTITVEPPNNAPIAVVDFFSESCHSIFGNLLFNDSDPDGDRLVINTTPVVEPVNGVVTIFSDGTFRYEFERGEFQDSFVYEVCDDHLYPLCDQTTVYIDIFADSDCDGVPDNIDIDKDNDGIVDWIEGDDSVDTDGDGIPDYLDIDADGDGIPDIIEAQATGNYIAPWGIDANNNGLDDAYETGSQLGLDPVDSDGDGIPDFQDTDSDNDGVPDHIEGYDIGAKGIAEIQPEKSDIDGDGLDDAYDNFLGGFNNDDLDNPFGAYPHLQDFDGHPDYLDFQGDCTMFIPEGFSPNDDGIHDYFQIYCIDQYPNAKLMIFDRWGG